MSRQQKEKFLKFSLKDKKLTRLFHNKRVSPMDSAFLNYIYEERQNLTFFYAVGGSGFSSITLNYLLFKPNSSTFRTFTFGSMFLIMYLLIKQKIDTRYETLLIPYFDKYKVK